MAENQGFGYASCIQYIPNSDGKSLVSVVYLDSIIPMTVVILGNNWLLIRASLQSGSLTIKQQLLQVKNKMIRIKFLNKILFHNKNYGIGRQK
jgi:hypothetical protein